MLLGKRPRPPIKRTTSMKEITFDLSSGVEVEGVTNSQQFDPKNPFKGLDQQSTAAASVSPRPRTQRLNSADVVETADFLRACSLCRRRLIPGHDIYMYRGDTAFCSLECRQQQMNQDERKEKCSVASKKEAGSMAAGSEVSTNGETVAAV